MASSQPALSDGQWEGYASVCITQHLHVRYRYGGPHPDMIDNEAIEAALDKVFEQMGVKVGDPAGGVKVDYASINVESETWHHDRAREARNAA